MRVAGVLSFVIVSAALVFAVTVRTREAAWSVQLQAVQSPSTGIAGQPQLSTSERGVLLSWIERSGATATLKFAERTPTGWNAARTVASGTDWFVNWADVPSVVRLSDGTLAAHWLQKSGPGTYAYDVRLSYSKDDGRTWSPSFTPHHDGTNTEHGFASLFEMPGTGLGVVWLDGRAMTAGGHDAHGGGDMSVRFAAFDRNWKQTAEMVVDARACECCPTATAVTSEGPIAAFRNRSESEIRDIFVSRFEGGAWTEPKAAHADNWKIAACPVNGPMLAARGREVALAWFTASGEEGRAFLAFSQDAGRNFKTPVRLDDGGSLGRVDVVMLTDGAAVASWIEFADNRAQFRMRRVERSGVRSQAMTVAGIEGNRTSGYPRVAAHADELVFAWVAPAANGTEIRTAVASLAPASTHK
jgi:hypothetical protein